MSGFYLVVTICLVATGFLIGWIASSAFGTNSWNALGAIGSWIGGLGAFAAAAIALHISRRQESRDTYKLSVNMTEFYEGGSVSFEMRDSTGNVISRSDGFIAIRAHNSGLRPIEIVELRYKKGAISGALPLTDFVVEPGRRSIVKLKDKFWVSTGNGITLMSPSNLLDFNVTVIDAAGISHRIAHSEQT